MYKLIILLFSCCAHLTSADVIVTLPLGQLNGRIEYSQRNISFYAFQSIPYGKAPVGELRFQEPQPAGRWDGVYDATRLDGNICYQIGATGQHESEDCLYLNVYTPSYPDENANLPVLVYIHGGAFLNGNGNFYATGPHYYMENGIIVVTVLYRLGPFGFLSTGDTVVPGNMGLKDQTLALQWVRDNIKYFGGDPTKVTINGASAGGASVTHQALSPKSAGLFRAVISESGSALNLWSYNRNYKQHAYDLANYCGASFQPESTTTEELVQYLRSVSAETLRQGANQFPWTLATQNWLHGFSFTPVIEPEHDGAFLTQNMFEVIASGGAQRVPYILGINSEEMIVFEASNLDNLNWNAQSLDRNLSLAVPNNMHLSDSNTLNAAGTALREIYTSNTFQSNLANAVRFYSDASFTHSIIHHAALQSAFSDVYFYQFSYSGQLGGNTVRIDGAEKVGHGEEYKYIWATGNSSNLNNYPAADVLTSDRLRGLFANFVKTLNPTPSQDQLFQNVIWPKVNSNNYQYINIDENLSIEVNPKGNTYPGWVNGYESYAVKPYDTF